MANVLSSADTAVGAGVFTRRIVVQQVNDTVPDGQGGTDRGWTTILSTWAHIEAWKGNEAWIAGQKYGTMWTQMLLRYRPGLNITPAMRVVYGRRTYEIRSVSVPAETQTTIQILCEELRTYGSLR